MAPFLEKTKSKEIEFSKPKMVSKEGGGRRISHIEYFTISIMSNYVNYVEYYETSTFRRVVLSRQKAFAPSIDVFCTYRYTIFFVSVNCITF